MSRDDDTLRELGRLAETFGLELSEGDLLTIAKAAVGTSLASRAPSLAKREPLAAQARLSRTQLAEALLVHETWFFREPAAFELVRQLAHEKRGDVFRVLSAPCSTGEEAYSIAMTLLDAGLTRAQMAVVGVDVSETALARARLGLFGQGALRGEQVLVNRWLRPVSEAIGETPKSSRGSPQGARYEVSETLRNVVQFSCENLVSPSATLLGQRFDVIFCRNLILYLSPPAIRRLSDLLATLLAPGGVLILGHADVLPEGRFVRLPPREAFAYGHRAIPTVDTRGAGSQAGAQNAVPGAAPTPDEARAGAMPFDGFTRSPTLGGSMRRLEPVKHLLQQRPTQTCTAYSGPSSRHGVEQRRPLSRSDAPSPSTRATRALCFSSGSS